MRALQGGGAMRRTRLGKIVGSQPKLGDTWYVAPDRMGKGGWEVVAPSGASMSSHATRAEADAECAREQREWDNDRGTG